MDRKRDRRNKQISDSEEGSSERSAAVAGITTFQVALLCKHSITHVTRIRFLSCMCLVMSLDGLSDIKVNTSVRLLAGKQAG